MKTFLFALLLTLFGLLQAQAQTTEFAPIGTKWWYSRSYSPYSLIPPVISAVTVECIGDTIVASKTLKVLEISISSYPRYVYQDSSKIYEAKIVNADSVALFCLYDFDAIMGDSYGMGASDVEYHVEGSDSIEINGFWLKRQSIIPSGPSIELIGGAINGTVIEQIGSIRYLFPIFKGDPKIYGLRCFEHPVIGHYETGIEATCDTVYTLDTAIPSVVENKPAMTANFDPQMAQLNLQIISTAWEGNFALYDLSGKVVANQPLVRHQASYQIDLSALPSGIYVYAFTDRLGAAVQRGKVAVLR